MRLDLVGLAPGDVDTTTIGFPARNAGRVMFVGIGDALVVLLAIFVFVGVRIGIAPAPEFFDETLALVVGLEFLESFALFVGDDVGDVFVQPVFVNLFEFRLYVALLLGRILTLVLLSLLGQARWRGKSES